MGKCSSGKDSIYKELVEDSTLGLSRIIMYTTRPIRTGETLSLKGRELLIGNVYAWLFMCYPVAVLRPGWLNVRRAQKNRANAPEPEEDEGSGEPTASYAEYRAIIDEWMQKEKPYLNPEFRLSDLRQAVPLNRTYLSQLINTEYGCSFYQFVTNYRIEEAKRLMQDNPNMFIQDIAEQSGFSSPTVFARIFSREVGMTPSEWSSKQER